MAHVRVLQERNKRLSSIRACASILCMMYCGGNNTHKTQIYPFPKTVYYFILKTPCYSHTSLVVPPHGDAPTWGPFHPRIGFVLSLCLRGHIVNGHYADTEELFYPSHHGSQWTIHNGKMHKRSNFLSSLIHIVSTAFGSDKPDESQHLWGLWEGKRG